MIIIRMLESAPWFWLDYFGSTIYKTQRKDDLLFRILPISDFAVRLHWTQEANWFIRSKRTKAALIIGKFAIIAFFVNKFLKKSSTHVLYIGVAFKYPIRSG